MKIYLVAIFLILSILALFEPYKKKIEHSIVGAIGFLFILTAVFRSETIRDYKEYVNMFRNYDQYIVEPSFKFLSWFVGLFSESHLILFAIYACVGISIKLYAIKRLSNLVFLSILVYFSLLFTFHDLIQMRMGVAGAFFLLSIKPLYERKFLQFIGLIGLASLFHISALAYLVLWFINPKKPNWVIIYLLIPISFIIGMLGINFFTMIPIPFIREKIELYMALQEKGMYDKITIFNPRILFKCLIYSLFLLRMKIIEEKSPYFILAISIYAIGISCYPLFSFLPVASNRLSELFFPVEIVLIPFLTYMFKPLYLSRLLIILITFTNLFYLLYWTDIFDYV